MSRGLDTDPTQWDAWRSENGRWTVKVAWKAGRSDNIAHFRFAPGAHGGTVTAIDDSATQLIDPNFDRPLRPVAPVAQLNFDLPQMVAAGPAGRQSEPEPRPETVELPPEAVPPQVRTGKRVRPTVPAWEDVLLGVRSSGDR
jgi:hypothetical protein